MKCKFQRRGVEKLLVHLPGPRAIPGSPAEPAGGGAGTLPILLLPRDCGESVLGQKGSGHGSALTEPLQDTLPLAEVCDSCALHSTAEQFITEYPYAVLLSTYRSWKFPEDTVALGELSLEQICLNRRRSREGP